MIVGINILQEIFANDILTALKHVMLNSLVLTWERNFEVTFGIFSVLVFQISVLESYLDIYLF